MGISDRLAREETQRLLGEEPKLPDFMNLVALWVPISFPLSLFLTVADYFDNSTNFTNNQAVAIAFWSAIFFFLVALSQWFYLESKHKKWYRHYTKRSLEIFNWRESEGLDD